MMLVTDSSTAFSLSTVIDRIHQNWLKHNNRRVPRRFIITSKHFNLIQKETSSNVAYLMLLKRLRTLTVAIRKRLNWLNWLKAYREWFNVEMRNNIAKASRGCSKSCPQCEWDSWAKTRCRVNGSSKNNARHLSEWVVIDEASCSWSTHAAVCRSLLLEACRTRLDKRGRWSGDCIFGFRLGFRGYEKCRDGK